MIAINCYCGSYKLFQHCCELYIKGIQKVPTAEALMRSRYSAYVTRDADYLMGSTHPSQREFHSKKEILNWAENNKWLKLEIISTAGDTVEFKAYFSEIQSKTGVIQPIQIHHEKSSFVFESGSWYYVNGVFY